MMLDAIHPPSIGTSWHRCLSHATSRSVDTSICAYSIFFLVHSSSIQVLEVNHSLVSNFAGRRLEQSVHKPHTLKEANDIRHPTNLRYTVSNGGKHTAPTSTGMFSSPLATHWTRDHILPNLRQKSDNRQQHSPS